MNETTTTANNAVQKNRVLIARSLKNDKRADLSVVIRSPIHFFYEFCHLRHQIKKKMCWSFLSRLHSVDGYITFISDDLLALRAEDVLDEVAGKASGLTIGDHIQVTGDRVGLGFYI